MSTLLIGIDAGNYRAKVAGPYGVDAYRTAICDWFPRNIVETHGSDDMEFEIDGRRGFAGTIATKEDIFGVGGMYGESKAHEDTKIRVLLGLYRYLAKYAPYERRVSIVTGQPIKTHKPEEKALIADMLRGEHVFTVNGELQRILIEEVGVAAEGSGSFWANTQTGALRIIDIGSGTVNCASIVDYRHINTASDSFNFGMETVNDSVDLSEVARAVIRATTQLKWRKTDAVFVCGGVANDILPHLNDHYPSAKVIAPKLRHYDGRMSILSPVYANAVGFYELARLAYEKARD